MTDFRALCAELLDELQYQTDWSIAEKLKERTSKALAESEPEGPTSGEVAELVAWLREASSSAFRDGWPNEESTNLARAAALLEQLIPPQPPSDEVAEHARWLNFEAEQALKAGRYFPAEMLTRAADLLEQLSPPQPIPVSERLPGPEDCDAGGRCWIYMPDIRMPDIGTMPSWRLTYPYDIGPYHTHWLPFNALPLPSADA